MSREVDEKVVSLQFDNANFERNAQTSINTLGKLNSSLNLQGATKGLKNLDKAANQVDFSSLNNAIDLVNKRFSVMGIAGMRVISNLTDTAMNSVFKAIRFIKSGIQNGGLSRAMNIENARFQIKGLQGDWDKLYEDIDYGVKGTAYGFDSAAKVAAQLTASGIKAGDQMKTVLRGISGVAAMTNSTYDDIGSIFTTVAGNGKVMTEQLRQLSFRGMNAAAILGKQLGKSEAEIYEMVKKSEISFNDFAKAMDDAFGEHAKEANDTFQGSMANIKSALSRIGADFFQPLIKQGGPLVQLFNIIRQRIDEIHKAVQPFATKLSSIITDITNRISKFIAPFDYTWNSISYRLRDAGVDTDKFKEKIIELGKKSGAITDSMNVNSENFVQSLRKGWMSTDLFNSALEELTGASSNASSSQEDLNAKLAYFQDVVDKVWRGDFKNAPERYQLLANAGYDYAKVQDLVNKTVDGHRLTLADLGDEQLKSIGYTDDEIAKIKELRDEASKTGTDLNTLITDISVDQSAPTKFEMLADTFKNIRNFIKGIGKAIKDAFFGTMDFKGMNKSLYDFIKGLDNCSKKLKINDKTADKLRRTFSGLFAIIDLIVSAFNSTVKIALTILGDILDLLGIHVDDVLDLTAAIGDQIVAFRNWVKSSSPLAAVLRAIAKIIAALIDVIGSYIDKLKENPKVQEAFRKGMDATNKVLKKFSEWIEEGSNKVVDLIEKLKDLDKQDLQNLGASIRDFVANAISDLTQLKLTPQSIPTDIINGFINGFKDKAGGVFAAIREIVLKVIQVAKDLLGIHSPSKVFHEIGANVIQGFINGVKDFMGGAFDAIGRVFDTIIGIAKNSGIKMSDVVVYGTIATLLSAIWKASKFIDSLTGPIQSFKTFLDNLSLVPKALSQQIINVGDALSTGIRYITDSMAKYFKAKKWLVYANALKAVAISIAILSGSMIALSLVPTDKLKKGGLALGAIAGGLVVLGYAMKGVDLKDIGSLAATFIGLAVAIRIIAGAMKKLTALDKGQLYSSVSAISILIITIGAMTTLMGSVGNDHMKSVAATLLAYSVSIRIIAGAIKSLAKISPSQVQQGTDTVVLLTVLMGALILLGQKSTYGDKKYDWAKIATSYLTMGLAMKAMAKSVKILGQMDSGDLAKGTITVALLGLLMKAIIKSTAHAGMNADKAAISLLGMAVAMRLMVRTVKIAGEMDPETVVKGIITIGLVNVLFLAVIAVSKLAGQYADKAGEMMMKMGLALISIGVAIKIMGTIDKSDIQKASDVISRLMLLMIGIIAVSKLAGENADKAGKLLKDMGLSLLAIAAAIAVLSIFNQSDIDKGVNAITQLMVMLDLLVVSSHWAGDAKETLKWITICVASLSAAIAVLTVLDPKRLIGATLCVDSLIAMLALLLKASGNAKASIKTLLVLGAVIAELAAILFAMSKLKVKSSLPNALALSTLLLAMSASMKILSGIGKVSVSSIGSLALMGLIIGEIGLIMFALSKLGPFDISLKATSEICLLLLAMTEVLRILTTTVAAYNPTVGIVCALNLIAFVGILGTFCFAVGALNKLTGGAVADFINESAPVFQALGLAIGSIISGLIEGMSQYTVMDSLISDFQKLEDFLNSVNVPDSTLDSVKNMCEACLIMSGTEFLNGLIQLFSIGGSGDHSDWVNQLNAIGEGLAACASHLQGVDLEPLKNLAPTMHALADLQEAMPPDGFSVLSAIIGNPITLDTFAKQLPSFIDSMKTAAIALQSSPFMTDGQNITAGFQNLSTAAGGLAELQKNMVRTGDNGNGGTSLIAALCGELEGIDDFGTKIVSFVNAMNKAATALSNGGFVGDGSKDVVAGFKKLAKVTDALADVQSHLQRNGGIIEWFVGQKDFKGFGDQVKALATAMKQASDETEKIHYESLNKLSTVADMLNQIREKFGDGGIPLQGFYSTMESLKTHMQSFNEGGVFNTAGILMTLSSLMLLANELQTIASGNYDITSFITALYLLKDFDFATLTSNMASAAAAAGSMQQVGVQMMVAIAAGIIIGQIQVTTAAIQVVNAAKHAASSATSGTGKIGTKFANKFASGVRNNSDKAKSAGSHLARQAKAGAKSISGHSAGVSFAKGYANGIRSGTGIAASAGAAIAKAAMEAAKKAQDSNSPSKETFKYGKWFVQGYANGIKDTMGSAIINAKEMALKSVNTVSGVISNIQNGEATMQFTPVIDSTNMNGYRWRTQLTGQIENLSFNDRVDNMRDAMDAYAKDITDSNNAVIDSIEGLRSDMLNYYNNTDFNPTVKIGDSELVTHVERSMTKKMIRINRLKK